MAAEARICPFPLAGMRLHAIFIRLSRGGVVLLA